MVMVKYNHHHHLVGDNEWKKSNLLLQKGPRIRRLLDLQMKSLISNWIDRKNDIFVSNVSSYDFELIFHKSQHGFSKSIFEDIQSLLPFLLLVANRTTTREVVNTLRKIYKF